MSSKKDYYETLGIPKSSSADEIKKAYRKLAMKYHPDRNAGDKTTEEKFKEIQEAYAILSDEQKRQAYDQFGHAGVDPNMGGGHGGPGGAGFGDVFGDIFGDIFGGGGRGRQRGPRKQSGDDLGYQLELSLEDAVHGVQREIHIPTLTKCNTCQGSGAKSGSKPITCRTCEGHGQVHMQQGFFTVQQTCPTCHGEGQVINDPCGDCRGRGRIREQKTLLVKVPAGVDHGDRIRLTGEGEAGLNGGPSGDLYVQIVLKPHPIFRREQSDLYSEIPISYATAVLGGEINVPTLEGHVKLKIPSETQSGKLFRLRGKGIKPLRGGPVGDLLCLMKVETPVHLTEQQKTLLRTLDADLTAGGDKHHPQHARWFDQVKKFFTSRKS